ncbi:MAG: hypothetical protein V8R14_02025 [Clostridia bacterium]
MVIRALRENDISILTHPGDKGPFDIKAIAEVCADGYADGDKYVARSYDC